MDLISSSPNYVIGEMTPKRNVIRECTEISPVIRDFIDQLEYRKIAIVNPNYHETK